MHADPRAPEPRVHTDKSPHEPGSTGTRVLTNPKSTRTPSAREAKRARTPSARAGPGGIAQRASCRPRDAFVRGRRTFDRIRPARAAGSRTRAHFPRPARMLQRVPSPPTRGRGSKQRTVGACSSSRGCRPPRGGVDRNGARRRMRPRRFRSPPTRGRGSRLDSAKPILGATLSPPTRGRGSKHVTLRRGDDHPPGRPPRGGVDRNVSGVGRASVVSRRPPRGGVDRNNGGSWTSFTCNGSRPPRGGVDRNHVLPAR